MFAIIPEKNMGSETELMSFNEIPQYLRCNKYILHNYRPLLTFKQSLLSIFQIHNQTGNIYTHGIPLFVILISMPVLIPWQYVNQIPPLLLLNHSQGLVSVWLGSFIFHTFMNHQGGEKMFRLVLLLDYLGIYCSQVIGSIQAIYIGLYCAQDMIQILGMTAFVLVNVIALKKGVMAKNLLERGRSFVPVFVFRIIMTYFRANFMVGGHPDAWWYYLSQEFWTAVGLIIGVSKCPERLFPGKFDLMLSSHNLLHMFPVMGSYYMHKAYLLDYEWLIGVKNGTFQC